MMALVIAPCLLAWWSVTLRLPLLDRTKQKLSMLSELDSSIATVKKGWTEEKALRTSQEWSVVHGQMIHSYEELAAWLEKTLLSVNRSGYTLNYRMEDPVRSDAGVGGLSRIPLKLDIRPRGQGVANYLKTLAIVHSLVDEQTGIQLDAITMKGGGKGMGEATISLTVWVAFIDRQSAGNAQTATNDSLPGNTG